MPGALILDFTVSRTVRNKCLFKPLSLWYFCYNSPNGLRRRANFRGGLQIKLEVMQGGWKVEFSMLKFAWERTEWLSEGSIRLRGQDV